MRGKIIVKGFSLKINVPLLAIVIVSAVIYSFSDKETLRNICLATGWILALLAVGPSLFGVMWENRKKGKPRDVDPNTIIPEWTKLRRSMGITKDIRVTVFPNLRNATSKYSTIEIGQPVIDSLGSVSIKGVFAHELAHIKGNHLLKQGLLLFSVLFAEAVLLLILCKFTPLGSSIFTPLFLFIGVMGIDIRFITWPFEYKADLIAKQYVGRKAVVSCLKAMAAIRKVDIAHDFYGHPSIAKRIANLSWCWSQKTRFKKWYFDL